MRYLPHSEQDQKNLLAALGIPSLERLFQDIPKKVLFQKELSLPPPLSEPELLKQLKKESEKNTVASPFLGGGSYSHFIPSVVKHIISRSEFYTAYTPYQAEASQGILQAIYEYQTMLCELTAMDVANASMYDGATAMVEAAFLACRVTGRKEIVVSTSVHPEYRRVLQTYAQGADLTVIEDSTANHPACVIIQQPNFFGSIEKVEGIADQVHGQGGLFIVSVDPISLGLLKAPGEYGADIVVGEGQALGNSPSFGGPGLGLFAAKKEFARQIPGRIAGQTVDSDGKRGFCLTLQTREQHIRRERATSNICSNEALMALAAAVYLSVMGKAGLHKVAELCLQKSNYLKNKLSRLVAFPGPTFKEFVIKTEKKVGLDLEPFYPELKAHRLICVTELAQKEELDAFANNLLSA